VEEQILQAIQNLQNSVNTLQATVNGIVSGGVTSKARAYYPHQRRLKGTTP